MKPIQMYNNITETNGATVVQSGLEALSIDNLIVGGKLGNNLAQALFTSIIESDAGFAALLNTPLSRQLKAMRDASIGGENVPIYGEDADGNLTLKNIPRMSFSAMTSEPDDCCVIAGDLQVCQDETILKAICIEKCEKELNTMVAAVSGASSTSAVYAAYKQMLVGAGVPKSSLPTLAEFEQLSLIGQFITLNMLTFINGLLSVEQNGNIVKRFSGLAQVYARPDVLPISGGAGVIEAFDQVLCRMNIIGSEFFAGGFFLASRTAYTAIQREVVPKRDGNYPAGWTVTDTTETVNGYSMPKKNYYFNGLPIIESTLVYIDPDTLDGDIYLVPPTVGIFSGVPLDMPASFILKEWEKPKSPFVHFDKSSTAFPDCWIDCDRLTNFGAVVSTEANALLKITGITAGCEPEMYKGVEGLININSYAPFIA
ncbi:hypothetical protein P7D72_06190 [Enterococcus avium]|uniref:Uncharacterized protein n=1 Tax=Enterococcus avium TaxID=33945 RepID=A0ABD5F6W4_ENTAV|nr:hypothetical protein [Enterococcus avium]MDT2484124.1 hypothetical protein [Enterococcus avium]MDT2491650.1 hypothetical protein [Enterococcus avium]MDT2510686.1 hypothetical protein [Enterococcus avium]MDT2513353.1 hypothetical protein [Enterococcus avium]